MTELADQVDMDDKQATRITTPALCSMLRTKYERQRWALFFDVPDAVSLKARRRIDAIACSLWQSDGHEIEGFELKVSRSDWLREVKQVDKADPFIKLCDRFWLVTGDSSIAKPDEIPECWGWMTATKTGLRIQRPARKLEGCGPNVPRAFMLGVMRKLQDDLMQSPDVQALVEERVKRVENRREEDIKYATRNTTRERDEALKTIQQFQETSGINLKDWRFGNVGEIVRQLKSLGFGDGLNHVPSMLEKQENELTITLENVRNVRAALLSHAEQFASEVLEIPKFLRRGSD